MFHTKFIGFDSNFYVRPKHSNLCLQELAIYCHAIYCDAVFPGSMETWEWWCCYEALRGNMEYEWCCDRITTADTKALEHSNRLTLNGILWDWSHFIDLNKIYWTAVVNKNCARTAVVVRDLILTVLDFAMRGPVASWGLSPCLPLRRSSPYCAQSVPPVRSPKWNT